MRVLAQVLLLSIMAFPTLAGVYRWVDDKGVVHYTDQPPAKDAKPTELPPLQTYKPTAPATPKLATGLAPGGDALEPLAPPAVSTVHIVSPQAKETIRDAEGKISVVVEAALQPGQSLIYTLDGKAQNTEATLSTGFLFTGVERGEHQIGATIVAADGSELLRAEPVTVFMMPSVIRKR